MRVLSIPVVDGTNAVILSLMEILLKILDVAMEEKIYWSKLSLLYPLPTNPLFLRRSGGSRISGRQNQIPALLQNPAQHISSR